MQRRNIGILLIRSLKNFAIIYSPKYYGPMRLKSTLKNNKNESLKGNDVLPGGVMATLENLDLAFLVRIQAGQPVPFKKI